LIILIGNYDAKRGLKTAMTKIEKIIIAAIIACVLILVVNLYYANKIVNKAGGIDKIVVSIGKEIKDIKKKIDE
jgi:cell division protein FtsL